MKLIGMFKTTLESHGIEIRVEGLFLARRSVEPWNGKICIASNFTKWKIFHESTWSSNFDFLWPLVVGRREFHRFTADEV